jgi:hypothetical protein
MEQSVIEGIINFILNVAGQNPKITAILAVAYLVGVAIKIVREAVEKFVLESPSKDDDLKLEEIKQNKVVKAVLFLADLLIRFKVK